MQKVPHAVLGALVGVSALVGVAGSLAYPIFRQRFGLERTGLLGMFLLVSCSSLALLSVFLPGSPLDLSHLTFQESEAIIESLNITETVDLKSVAAKNWLDPKFWAPVYSVLVLLSGIILAR
jgi:iron-regulated transporter 1